MEGKNLNVAMIQSNLIWEDSLANLDSFEHKLSKMKEGTDLVVLPEMFSTGFSMNTSLAEGMDGQSVAWMIRQAQCLNSHICGSLMIKENDKIYNRFIFANPEGNIEFYDKKHLFSMANENEFFCAGIDHTIINIKGFKLNLMVCYDLRFPVWSRNVKKEERYLYDGIIYVANWPSVRSSVWQNLLKARAAENMAFVVGVNRVGEDEKGLSYDGHSALIDPWGNVVAEGEKGKEEILYGQMNMSILTNAREKFPVSNDADGFSLLG